MRPARYQEFHLTGSGPGPGVALVLGALLASGITRPLAELLLFPASWPEATFRLGWRLVPMEVRNFQ